jgi:uncharacterized protein (DUF58 family)
MIRPTRRAVVLFAGPIPAAWLAMLFGYGVWALVLYASFITLLAIALDAMFMLPRYLVKVALSHPGECYLGDEVKLCAAVSRAGRGRPVTLEILAEVDGEAASAAVHGRVVLDQHGETRCILTVRPRRRGILRMVAVTLAWQGRLGLVQRLHAFPMQGEVRVLPNVRMASQGAIEYFSRESLFGVKVQRYRGGGTEFDTLREYSAGFDTRLIDWKRSARHRTLLCKEFRAERNHHVVFCFDTGYLMQEEIGGISRLDHAIHAALLLSWVALRSGDLVGSYGFDSQVHHFAAPGQGAPAYARLQRAAVDLPYGRDESNFTLGITELRRRLKRRSLVILLTEFVDTVTAEILIENITHLARRHVIVFVTLRDPHLADAFSAAPAGAEALARSLVAAEFERDRALVLRRLGALGIHCLDVAADHLPLAVLNRYLLIREKELQ